MLTMTKKTETPEERNNRIMSILPMIKRVAREIARESDYVRDGTVIETADVEQHLVLSVMNQVTYTSDHPQLRKWLKAFAGKYLIECRNQKGPRLATEHLVTGEVAYAFTVDEVKRYLSRDWDELPTSIKEALNHKTFSEQKRDALYQRYSLGIIPQRCSPEANRQTRAINHLLEILNLKSLNHED